MKILLVPIFLACLAGTSRSQITITSDDFGKLLQNANDIATWRSQDATGLQALVLRNGPNQTWDFTGRSYSLEPSPTYFAPYPAGASMANDTSFRVATEVMVDTSSKSITRYSFYRLDASGFVNLGGSEDSLGVPSKVDYFYPPSIVYKFPLTYQLTWTNTTIDYNLKYGPTPDYSDDDVVDGWGTLILPNAPPQQTLRLVRHYHDGYSSFNWLTNSLYFAFISVSPTMTSSGTEFQAPKSGSSVADAHSSTHEDLQLIATPGAPTFELSYYLPEGGAIQIALMDVLGGTSRMLVSGAEEAGAHRLTVDAEALANGAYFVRMVTPAGTETRKIMVAR